MRSTQSLLLALFAAPALIPASGVLAQTNPLSFVTQTTITDNNAGTNETGYDASSINSTPFKNESLWTVGDYQFGTYYREDGKLMVVRRDLTAPTNNWDIRVTEFTSFNINDNHNVPVIGIDGDGYLHLAWGTHADPLLYTRSNTPVTAGQAMSFIGDTVGNSAAPNTMTGTNETGTTYPNFIHIPGSGDLLFNYRTGGSGNGTYRLSHWDDATNNWSWRDQTWIRNTDSSGLTYNAYPQNLTYDANGGLHATWTYRYNNSSPTGNPGYQTNHNIHYAYSPDDGATWFKDINGTVAYPSNIDESNSQVIVNIPEGSSLINATTQATDQHGRPAVASWWAPHAHDAQPDHRRQYMYVGHDGTDWFTSQITHRAGDDPDHKILENELGVSPMGRPQILIDDYNRAFVVFSAASHGVGNGIMVAYSQADSRDDWEFLELITNAGNRNPTPDRALWDATGEMHFFIQRTDGNSNDGGSDPYILEWDAQAALGRVLEWTGQSSTTWDGTAVNFTDLGTPVDFDDFDNVNFTDASSQKTVTLAGDIDAGKVVVDSSLLYTFTGPGALTSGSLSVVGGGTLVLATDDNTYDGPTRVSNATLVLAGDASSMTSDMIVADGGTLIMASSDAATMASTFEVWPTGTLQIGTPTSTTEVFPNNPTSLFSDGLIRVYSDEWLSGITGRGSIEIAGGVTILQNNPGVEGGVTVKPGAWLIAFDADALGTGALGDAVVEDGGTLRLNTATSFSQEFNLAGEGGGMGALQLANATNITLSNNVRVSGFSTAIDVGAGATGTINNGVIGTGGLTKQGDGTLRLEGNNTYAGRTVVRGGVLQIDQATGFGETIVDPGGTLESSGNIRGNLTVNNTGVVRIVTNAAVAASSTVFQDNFSGGTGALDGTTPDISSTGANWVAAPTFLANGDSIDPNGSGNQGGSATLAFTPVDGQVYTLEATIENITGDNDWFGVGFANGQSSSNGGNHRFLTGDVTGIAWAMYRGQQISSSNQTFLGDLSDTTNPGINTGGSWLAGAAEAGGDVDIRLTLDTTGGAGAWTILMEGDTGSGYQIIRATQTLLDETIDSVGIANANANDLTGTLQSFVLATNVAGPSAHRTLDVAGDVVLNSGAVLDMSLFSTTDHDVLDVAGTFNAAGTLSVALDSGAASPQLGDSFDLLDFASAAGAFDGFSLPTLGAGLFWDTAALLTTGELAVTDVAPFDPADLDQDGDVDDADFGLAFAAFTGPNNGPSSNPAADLDNDGDVDDADFGLAFAAFTGPGGPANVPEPHTLSLLAICSIGLMRRR